jgi:hypothetical protein
VALQATAALTRTRKHLGESTQFEGVASRILPNKGAGPVEKWVGRVGKCPPNLTTRYFEKKGLINPFLTVY